MSDRSDGNVVVETRADPPGERATPGVRAEPDDGLGVGASRGIWFWVGWGAFWAALVLLAASVPLLAWVGKEAVLDSTEGRTIDLVTDPEAPGYEVLVEPTETLLMVHTGPDDELLALTFLARSSDETASALFLPVTTAVSPSGETTTLRDAYRDGGMEGLVDGVESVLGVGVAEFTSDGGLLEQEDVMAVDSGRWADLVEPVAPLTVQNLDPVEVRDDDGEVVARYPEGELTLGADAVGPFLEARSPGESDLNRLQRHQSLWEAWLDAIREGGGGAAIPGEQESGLGRFVGTMAGGEAGLVIMPAGSYRIPGTSEDVFLPESEAVGGVVQAMVPFPEATSPGARITLRVLDGTGTPGAAFAVGEELARTNGEIRSIGNGPAFDYVGTQIIYYDPAHRDSAESVAEALDAGSVELRESPDEVVMVTVILGSDVVDELDL